ncbi:endolytic transglycosylase MltG [Nocardioides acrostichi]|uniref:Endolytic murein transglycosylase n=1 Tax=Nocardioides acrostichi TaxID=2784339 RepID=A0A930V1S2_9ACTN|nr:endolytic transglycosylase MltG [Nocardioides acrostichi]MBF4162182.1 endolytic transglycosylase MltG [Nocardioides acrostichi]
MSDDDTTLLPGNPDATVVAGGRRRRRRSRLPGCLAVLVALAIVLGGGYFAVSKGKSFLDGLVSDPEDYAGPGRGSVTFEVASGDTATTICRNLKDEKVVASVDACIAAANANEDAGGIQVGYYSLKKKMASADAIDVLVDPANLVKSSVTIPEGLRVEDIVAKLADATDFSASKFEAALKKPDKIGLPSYAKGNAEGYLFPATYDFGPNAKPSDMLRQMVDRWRQAADDADLEARAKALGYTPEQLMTVASLVQAEGRGDDMPKIARVIYNRLEIDSNPSAGFLQVDASVNYALGREPIARLTTDDIDSVSDSPYNTYTQKGLPPTPIEAPGDDAIAAAANPADGPWFFYVTVNLATGETKFTDSYDQFLAYKRELDEYCANESDRC